MIQLIRSEPHPQPGFAPERVLELELSEALPAIDRGVGEFGVPYRAVRCLVRLHGQPLGLIELDLAGGEIRPALLADAIRSRLGVEVASHLRSDGLDASLGLTANGLPAADHPPCILRQEQFLLRAPSVTVAIPTRDRPQQALAAAESVLRGVYPTGRYEVLIVDNGSDPTALAQLEAGADRLKGARVLREPVPGGANARNAALRDAEGEIIAFADDDVIVDRHWLAKLVAAFDGREFVQAASGLVLPREIETQSQLWLERFGGFTGGFRPRLYDLGPNRPSDQPLFPFTVGALGTGANMAFRTAEFRRAGGFDPVLGTATPARGGEDLEALLRVILAGGAVAYEPAALVHHSHPREYAQLRERMFGYGVGLTALLARSVLHRPRLAFDLLRKVPRGISFALRPGSEKNRGKQADFPAEFTRAELRGMLYGPFAYARSRRFVARRSQTATGSSQCGR
jgi:glycosyltransferase involved in cell wall biosynthesis